MVAHETFQTMMGYGYLAALGVFLFFILAAVYIYSSLAWMTIANKLKYKYSWLAWIPFANVAMVLQLGGFHWAWVFLVFIPILGWIALFVLIIISTWRIFEKRKHPGWFSLSIIIPQLGSVLYLIAIGIVAWVDKKGKTKSVKKVRRKKK
jgi:hypothetical protein